MYVKKEMKFLFLQGNIIPVLFQTFGGPFYWAGFLRLIIDLMSFASPQILSLLITFTASPADPMWQGIVYAAALLILSLLTAVINGQHQFNCMLVGYRIRTALISAIYRKALTISNAAKKNTTVGEIVNLMAVDAQRFVKILPLICFFFY